MTRAVRPPEERKEEEEQVLRRVCSDGDGDESLLRSPSFLSASFHFITRISSDSGKLICSKTRNVVAGRQPVFCSILMLFFLWEISARDGLASGTYTSLFSLVLVLVLLSLSRFRLGFFFFFFWLRFCLQLRRRFFYWTRTMCFRVQCKWFLWFLLFFHSRGSWFLCRGTAEEFLGRG